MIKVSVIKNFPNYIVDTDGNVYNKRGRKLKSEVSTNGYMRVSLSNNECKHKKHLVHRLVAEAFIPNPNDLPQVNHKNEDRTNNSVSNLEWCTALDNLLYSDVIKKASKANEQVIRCVDTGVIYESIKSVCDIFGVHHSNVVACCKGRRNSCGGMKWEYVN